MRHLLLASLLIGAGLSPASSQVPTIETLHLVCLGGGSANKVRSSSVYAFGSDGNSAWGNVIGTRDVPFEDQVNIEIANGEGRIRMPRSMLPPIRGGKDGWFKLKNIKVSENEITARAALNFINAHRVRVDRITGMISISGREGDYSGECQPYDPATVQRKF